MSNALCCSNLSILSNLVDAGESRLLIFSPADRDCVSADTNYDVLNPTGQHWSWVGRLSCTSPRRSVCPDECVRSAASANREINSNSALRDPPNSRSPRGSFCLRLIKTHNSCTVCGIGSTPLWSSATLSPTRGLSPGASPFTSAALWRDTTVNLRLHRCHKWPLV